MKRWLFNLAAGVSLLLCLAIIALLVRSYWAVDFAGWYDGVGGACGMTSCSGVIAAYRDRNGFGTGQSGYYYGRDKPDFWGAGPSFFAQVDSNLGRTNLSVPHWFVSILLAVLPLLRWWTYHKGRQLYRAGLCVHCGYDLRATPDRCPECGTVPAPVIRFTPRT